jgi:hypothetical protein
MESDAKFDLNTGIEEWRQSALRAGIPRSELEELEDHIRSSVSAAVDSGADPEGSFSSVVFAMGGLGQLGRDYRRDHRAWPWFLRWAMPLPTMIAFSVIAQVGGMLIGSSLAGLIWDSSTTIWLSKIFASFPMGFAFVMVALLVAPDRRVGVAWASVAVVCVWAVALLSAGSGWVAWMGVSGALGAFGAMGMRGIVNQSFLDSSNPETSRFCGFRVAIYGECTSRGSRNYQS